MKICIYGGLFGSEGKGCVSEWVINQMLDRKNKQLIVTGDNSPNSGHTCIKGKTRNLPAASFFANVVLIGPDAVIDVIELLADVESVRAVNPDVQIYIHEHVAICSKLDGRQELDANLIDRIGSTGSGSGYARFHKQYRREESAVLKNDIKVINALSEVGIRILTRASWLTMISQIDVSSSIGDADVIFECGQGILLDVNHGYYPYVTSRSTLPAVAIARNGWYLGGWKYYGVYRTFPIRTGGNSGPTAGCEVSWSEIGVNPEIATVTKRIRRVFKLSADDLIISFTIQRPDIAFVTHGDYISKSHKSEEVGSWLHNTIMFRHWPKITYVSFKPSEFQRL